jgi:PST family polysaccharide transporter
MFILALIIIIPFTIFSKQIVTFLYGPEFKEGGQALSIHIFSSLFIFLGSVKQVWAIIESKFKFIFYSNMVAGLINIGLNYLFITNWGIVGAAYATLIGFGLTHLIFNFFYKPAWKILKIQLKTIFLIDIFIKIRKAI